MYAKPTVNKLLTFSAQSSKMMQNDKVQNWVNSLLVEHGEDIHENNATENGLIVNNSSNNRVVDDMTLGAEAKSVMLTDDGREESVEILNGVTGLTNGEVESGVKFRYKGGTCGSGNAAVQLLRQRFRVQQQDSINSESSHLTIDSIDQLLWERRGDPEKILENLGFVGKIVDRRQRIPERFLKNSSKANGISVEQFLEKNPWLKDYLEQKAALQKPFEAINMNANSESYEEIAEIEPEVETMASKRMTSFHQVASTVAMINRFRGLVRRLNANEPELEPLVEPILRNSTKGTKYWSILTLDNYNFLDKMGYYEMQLGKPSRLKDVSGRFSLAANRVSKQLSGTGPMNFSQEPTTNGHSDNEQRRKQSEKLDKILRSRSTGATEKGKQPDEKNPEIVESPVPKDLRFSVPERFFTSQSMLFGPVQQMTGESVSELFRKTSDSNLNLLEVSDAGSTSSHDITLKDVNANTVEVLPKIAIDSASESRPSRSDTVESFDYEWQRPSTSSTEGSSFSDSDDRTVFFVDSENVRMDTLGLTVDDVGRSLLRVPSDAASNLSGHTLRDLENASEPDTCTDALQMSQDSLSAFCSEQLNSSEQSVDPSDDIHNASSQLNREKDISNGHLPPVLTFSSKIRDVLRRQGSSQSDSSGFVDSDHLDSALLPDSYYPNKGRYMNRQMKLDTISSQDSTSLEEDSNFSSQSDFFHSPQSVFSPSANQNFTGGSTNRIRILKGDFRNEFWSTKHSVETQTGWESFLNCTEDQLCTFDGLNVDDENSMKERFLSQPEIYTTRLYVDSLLPRTSVPLVERAEVMLILDGSKSSSGCGSNDEDSNLQSVYHVSSVDVEVTKTKDGGRCLTPLLFSSGKTATVKSQSLCDELHFAKHKQQQVMELDFVDNDKFMRTAPLQTDVFNLLEEDVMRRKALSLDFSDHQVLHSLLKQSVFISPQCAAALLPPSHWSTFGDADISQKQHLVEEVKLLQNALQKYRLEVKVLQMQTKKLYMNESSCLLSGERDNLVAMEELHEAISKELDNLDTQLSQRMKLVISIAPRDLSLDVSFSCLSIINQMTELLKEQINHGNIINGMSIILPSARHSTSGVASFVKTSEEHVLLEKISSLEEKMEEQRKTFEACLGNAMKQIQEIMQPRRQDESPTSNRSSSTKNHPS